MQGERSFILSQVVKTASSAHGSAPLRIVARAPGSNLAHAHLNLPCADLARCVVCTDVCVHIDDSMHLLAFIYV